MEILRQSKISNYASASDLRKRRITTHLRRAAVASVSLWCLVAFFTTGPAYAQFGPETCKQGFVWREACGPNDHVCVTAAVRAQAAADNSAYASRRAGSGPYGPDTCKPGFVWREACGPQDHVCVSGATRTEAAQDNAQAAARFVHTPVLADVLTQHNDPARSGAQLREAALTPANVTPATFGRLYERNVNGQVITQPLYVDSQWVTGKGLRNVVYVATRRNWIYAFDADSTDPDPNHGLLWSAPVHVEPDGPVPGMCRETYGSVGITSTPVIDRATDTMYVVARKSDGSIWLHALDIATGQPKARTPGSVMINVPGGPVPFNQNLELSRAALLFEHGAIFIAFSALNCDNAGWHGWVLAYRAPDLTQVGAFVTTHGGEGGGVWQSGNGLVSDGAGHIYFATGNGPVNGTTDLGESIVKLNVGPPPFYGLSLGAKYTVTNFNALNGGDTDLGSGGPTLLPGNRIIAGGKQGKLYVLDAGSMAPTQAPPAPGPVPPGGSDGFQAFVNSWHDDSSQIACTNTWLPNRHCYLAHHRYEDGELTGPNVHGGPIFWQNANPSYDLIYGMPEKDFLRAFRYNHATHQVNTSPATVSTVRSPDGMPGSHLSLSANGASQGIVWALVPRFDGQWRNVPGSLVAFDALTLHELWRDDDDIGFSKFTPPTVAGGKVFRPTFADKLVVYGPRSSPATTPCYNIAQKYQNFTGAEGLLGAATTGELGTPDGIGHFQHYQTASASLVPFDTAGGSIYWTPTTCAHVVQGPIHIKWSAIGWERSPIGYPVTDMTATPDGLGRYNHFQSGSIYWSPLTGAYEVHGLIRDRWASLGWERSTLGYPISDETNEINGTGRFSLFQHGSIHWNRSTNAVTVNSNAGILIGPGRTGIDRPGSDIANIALTEANPAICQQQCADNASCRAWTFVNPGVQGPQARCYLKGTMPVEVANACCTSGIKVDVHPAGISGPAGAVDRPGSDYANFDLAAPDFRLCQGECAASGTCRAWSYVEVPGYSNNAGHCWLKNASPAAAPNGCCISGSK
jgi:hypothetical protein